MKRRLAIFLMTLSLLLTWFAYSPAKVEWDVQGTLIIKENIRDVAMSLNGRWIFVLTDKGEVLIYPPDGIKESITVGDSIDGIKAGPREDILLLTSRKNSTVKVITLDFIQDINVADSPFKGPADAPVVIATFDDFQ
jgi:hypothetical protein